MRMLASNPYAIGKSRAKGKAAAPLPHRASVAVLAEEDTPVLDPAYLDKLDAYLRSGDFAFDFEYAEQARKLDMLDFLDRLMDLAELADATATKIIFKDTQLGLLAGMSDQNQREPEGEG
jgi:hypothetical protein